MFIDCLQNFIIISKEKERRRQHMLLVKQFDTRKRNEERRKKMEELRLEREKEKERRTETRRMELEILSEMKRPVEDMAVPDPRLVTDIFFFFVSVYVPPTIGRLGVDFYYPDTVIVSNGDILNF
jgi:hypothetical protein